MGKCLARPRLCDGRSNHGHGYADAARPGAVPGCPRRASAARVGPAWPARSVGRDQSGSTVRRGTSGGAACGGCGRGSPSSDGDRFAPEGSQERLGTAATSGARPGRVGRVLRRRAAEAGLPKAVSAHEADELLKDAETFLSLAEEALGVTAQPLLPLRSAG